MPYTIQLAPCSASPLAVVRRRAVPQQLSRVVPEACGIVWNELRSRQITGAGRHVAVYFDDQINLEVGVEFKGPFSGSGDVVPSATPAGLVASTTHFGPYQQLGSAHDAIHRWCRQNGHVLAGPRWEVYGHWQDAWNRDPSLIRTDVFYLLGDQAASTTTPPL